MRYSVFNAQSKDLQNLELKINGAVIGKVDSCKYLCIYMYLSRQEHSTFLYNK